MHQPERCGLAETFLVSPVKLFCIAQTLNHVTDVTAVLVHLRATTKVQPNIFCNHMCKCVSVMMRGWNSTQHE